MSLAIADSAFGDSGGNSRPAPLLPIAIGLIAGITIDNALALSPPMAVAMAVCVGSILAVFAVRGRSHTALIACIILFATATGAVRHAVRMRYFPPHHIARLADDAPRILTISGRIITPPRIVETPSDAAIAYAVSPKTRFILDVHHVEGDASIIDAVGRINVSIKEPILRAQLGDDVRITGRLFRPMPPANPGARDWALQNRRAGIHAALSTDHAAAVVTTRRQASQGPAGILDSFRRRAIRFLLNESALEDDPAAGVLTAMVLGQRSRVDQTLNEAFIRTGAAHFLAASGLHVGWLALIGWWFARLVGMSNRQCAAIVALLIIVYVLLAEPRPSILRAGTIGVLACLGIYRSGQSNTLNWLAASAILLLMMNPTDVFRPAFQFSYVAVLSIVYLRPVVDSVLTRRIRAFQRLDALDAAVDAAVPIPLTPKLPRKRELVTNELLRAIRLTLTASLAVWIANVPLAAYHFNRIAPLGWLYNIFLWIPAFIVTAFGFVKVVVGAAFPSSALLTAPLLDAATTCFLWLVQHLASIPGGLVTGNSPSLLWVVAGYVVIAFRIWRPTFFETRRWTIAIYVALILWWIIPARWVRQDTGALNVWMLAVGDGTGTVIELPDGRAMLFDFGTRSPFDASFTANAFLAHRAIHEIDTAFVSHANFDHYGAIAKIHAKVPIRTIVLCDQFESFVRENDSAWRFLKTMREANVDLEIVDGPRDWTDAAGVRFEIIAPPAKGDRRAPSANDSSQALRLTYQDKSILLTGDQAEWGNGNLLSRDDVSADVLMLPHHGSVVHNTRALIDAVNPSIAIRSTGQRRRMTTNGIDSLVGPHRQYLSTADNGCVRIRIKNHRVDSTTFIESESLANDS